MLEAGDVRGFSLLPQPVLTAYLDTNPAKAPNRGPTPAYFTWLNTAGKSAVADVPAGERKLFEEQVKRVEAFLRDRVSPQRGMLLFAGPKTWQAVPLQVEVENELDWGKPALAQLLGLLSRHKPYGIAVVDLGGARFFHYRLGSLSELEEKKFAIDISEWRKKDMGKVSRPKEPSFRGSREMKKARGSDHDTFEHRMDEEYRHLCAETAQRARQLSEAHGLAAFFLVGDDRLIDPIAASFPREFQSRVVKVGQDFGRVVSPALEERLEPHIEEWERTQESESVTALLDGDRGTVIGIDETLNELQKGGVRVLVLAADLDPSLRQCVGCGRTDRTADPVCPVCGAQRVTVSFRQALPELAWKNKAEIEIIGGKASARLKEAGGMGGWLRLPKQTAAGHRTRRAG